ncbi:MAG: response regulator transcription factor, partial [Planctomycetes bacterium]|nr:response regulator transcription factor [Planctomycetota bacterium]
GLELVKDIRSTWPTVLVLVLSMHDENIYGSRAMNAGANGYIMKEEGIDKILEAMHRVIIGGVYASDALRQQMLNSGLHNKNNTPIDSLSNREITVFELIGKGLSTNDIATTLEISAKTVSAHREHIKSKLQIEKNDQLIQQATRWVLELNNCI